MKIHHRCALLKICGKVHKCTCMLKCSTYTNEILASLYCLYFHDKLVP